MSISTSTAPEPIFPPEVSSSLLNYLNWPEAWEKRVVCQNWRDYVENTLAPRRWLHDVEIIFDAGIVGHAVEDKMDMCLNFSYERVEENGVAVFAETRKECREDFKELAKKHCSKIRRPITTMSDFAHDIVLPGLVIDWEMLELRLEWRELIIRFMREENKAQEKFSEKLRQQKASVLGMRAQIDAGKLDEMAAFERVLRAAGDAHNAAYRETRAERLGRSDSRGDEKLEHIRFMLSMSDRDDDEDGTQEGDSSDEEWVTDEESSGADS